MATRSGLRRSELSLAFIGACLRREILADQQSFSLFSVSCETWTQNPFEVNSKAKNTCSHLDKQNQRYERQRQLQPQVGSDSIGSRFTPDESVRLDQWRTFDLDG